MKKIPLARHRIPAVHPMGQVPEKLCISSPSGNQQNKPWDRYYYYPCFTVKETMVERVCPKPQNLFVANSSSGKRDSKASAQTRRPSPQHPWGCLPHVLLGPPPSNPLPLPLSPGCTLCPRKPQPHIWSHPCTANPKSAYPASSRSKTIHLSHHDSLHFQIPKSSQPKGGKSQKKKKNRNGIILPSKRQSLPPGPASPVRASPCAPSIRQEIWVILTPISSSQRGGPQVLLAPSSRKWHQPLSSWLTLLPLASTLILSFQDFFSDL